LKLKNLLVVEGTTAIAILVVVLVLVQFSPFLASTTEDSHINVYDEKVFATGNLTLAIGQTASAQFNYSTYDPAILVTNLVFRDWQTPGDLSVYCNGRLIATIHATPTNPTIQLTTISVSGWDWVKPPSLNAFTYGNEVTFASEPANGYAGTFSYQIDIRGSR
jgi:hypothetical protein